MKIASTILVSVAIIGLAGLAVMGCSKDSIDPEKHQNNAIVSIDHDFNTLDSIKFIQHVIVLSDTGYNHIKKSHMDSDFLKLTFEVPKNHKYKVYSIGTTHDIPTITDFKNFDAFRIVEGDTIPVAAQVAIDSAQTTANNLHKKLTLKRINAFVILDCWAKVPDKASYLEVSYDSDISFHPQKERTTIRYRQQITEENRSDERLIVKSPILISKAIYSSEYLSVLKTEVKVVVYSNANEELLTQIVGPISYTSGQSATTAVIMGNPFLEEGLFYAYQVGGIY